MRRLTPILVSYAAGLGLVLAEFTKEPRPVHYLNRPAILLLGVAALVGSTSLVAGRAAVVTAAVGTMWIIAPHTVPALVGAVAVVGLIVHRLMTGKVLDVSNPVAAATALFMVGGMIPVVPQLSWAAPAEASTGVRPQFLVLLDGYPRSDTLSDLGIDNTSFVRDLEARGFDIYPEATSHHSTTYRTLTYMVTGEPMANDGWGESYERKAARDSWYLPDFVTVAPPFGSATFPRNKMLNPGGFSDFEVGLAVNSPVGGLLGQWMVQGFRSQLLRAIEIVSTTTEPKVFAHLFAPHLPFVFPGAAAPPCWPSCLPYDREIAVLGYTVEEYSELMGTYLEWLNPKLLAMVDSVQKNHPDVEIVLFSDHGARYEPKESDEWHQTFLAAFTPSRPRALDGAPHPEAILSVLG